ncbi:hypothetical protein P1J22_08125 [Escherichia coli]|nr:hypothetical protein [Escherichia coli]WES51485.1 hypothetical protein P1J22_08125 [Escherichia coli]WES56912.1 hypothetical protein P1J23_12425 [Escherichia coli]
MQGASLAPSGAFLLSV